MPRRLVGYLLIFWLSLSRPLPATQTLLYSILDTLLSQSLVSDTMLQELTVYKVMDIPSMTINGLVTDHIRITGTNVGGLTFGGTLIFNDELSFNGINIPGIHLVSGTIESNTISAMIVSGILFPEQLLLPGLNFSSVVSIPSMTINTITLSSIGITGFSIPGGLLVNGVLVNYIDIASVSLSALGITAEEIKGMTYATLLERLMLLKFTDMSVVTMTVRGTPISVMTYDSVIDWDGAQRIAKRYIDYSSTVRQFTPNLIGYKTKLPTLKSLTDDDVSVANKWKQLFDDFVPPTLVTLPDNEMFYKAISDLRVPKTAVEHHNQLEEIRWFKQYGYNALVVTYLGEEDVSMLVQTMTILKQEGWRFIMGMSLLWGDNLYKDPDIYKNAFQKLVPFCDFALSGWRDLSNGHHWGNVQAENWHRDLGVLAMMMREVNPTIPIIGECWFNDVDDLIRFDQPWTSGVLLGGGGISNIRGPVSPNPIGFAKLVDRQPIIAVITGLRPHFGFTGENHEEMRKACVFLEDKFTSAARVGYRGTITLVGSSHPKYDNLCISQYRLTGE